MPLEGAVAQFFGFVMELLPPPYDIARKGCAGQKRNKNHTYED